MIEIFWVYFSYDNNVAYFFKKNSFFKQISFCQHCNSINGTLLLILSSIYQALVDSDFFALEKGFSLMSHYPWRYLEDV